MRRKDPSRERGSGKGKGGSKGQGRGHGKGQGKRRRKNIEGSGGGRRSEQEKGERRGDGCVCLNCGERVPHQRDVPCFEQRCPSCGSLMKKETGQQSFSREKKKGDYTGYRQKEAPSCR